MQLGTAAIRLFIDVPGYFKCPGERIPICVKELLQKGLGHPRQQKAYRFTPLLPRMQVAEGAS